MRNAIKVVSFISLTQASYNGGDDCFGCTAGVSLIRQYAHKLNTTGSVAFPAFCDLQVSILKETCNSFIRFLSRKYDIDKITSTEDYMTPDDFCRDLEFCYTEPNRRECNLFPKIQSNTNRGTLGIKKSQLVRDFAEICTGKNKLFCAAMRRILVPVDTVNYDFDGRIEDHLPQFDADGDGFSSRTGTLRGWHWRGYDCDDSRSRVSISYPGKRSELSNWDDIKDSNCNGMAT